MTIYKTLNNHALSLKVVGETHILSGWVMRRRDHGGVIFVDLRDQSGFCQVVFRSEISQTAHSLAQSLRNEWVIRVEGTVKKRSKDTINLSIPTGHVELDVQDLSILSASKPTVFALDNEDNTHEEIRLRYRYLDLRRLRMQKNIQMRYAFIRHLRETLDAHHFIEIETPILNKTTPEGARDFLVPSRIHAGHCYALPQSPQIFKQILMISGFERYFQMARCFRDEDLRADRQPEFTQLDIETSFLSLQDSLRLYETIFLTALKRTFPAHNVPSTEDTTRIPQITYQEALERYGTDRPDTRFDLPLYNPEGCLKQTSFQVFQNTLKKGGIIRMLCVKEGAKHLSRKDIDNLTSFVSIYGAKGLAWMKVANRMPTSNITKFFTEDSLKDLVTLTNAHHEDLFLFVADAAPIVYESLGQLRLHLAKRLNLIDPKAMHLLWIVDFPLFQHAKESDHVISVHHPFTRPQKKHLSLLETNPLSVLSEAYDLVLNGTEIGGGSLRIHEAKLQETIFKQLQLSPLEIQTKFGFLLEALSYGAPPHGGIAFGIDRIVALMQGETSIREVIPFPKTQKGQCLMSEAPSIPFKKQMDELHMTFKTRTPPLP